MRKLATGLLAFCGAPLDRRAYGLWGVGLFFLKWNLDRILVAGTVARQWLPWSYYSPVEIASLLPQDRALALTLVLVSLPFIAIGVVLTVRRLRDAGWPPWLAALFFVPFVNIAFFLTLSLLPTRRPDAAPESTAPQSWLRRMFTFESALGSAAAAVVLTVLLLVPLVAFGTVILKNYGWGLFVGLPFIGGFLGACLHGISAPRSIGPCLAVGALVVLLAGGALVLFALEGIICILMAAPLALPLALLGAATGYAVQREQWQRRQDRTAALYSGAWALLPLLLTIEGRVTPAATLLSVTTSAEIAAPAAVVWRHVVEFSELPPPREWVFRSGIAYPVRAHIDGRGVGAVRRCEFSTGPFVEPITTWDEPRHLAFDVVSQPHPMRELSPYRAVHPPHLEGFFLSRRGEFRLVELSAGRTRLDGTTWYEQRLWPAPYWQVWSDWLVHTIHARVLQHIKAEAESERRP